MHLFLKFIFLSYILVLMSCSSSSDKKLTTVTNEKFYNIESLNEADIVSEPIESYDTSKMIFIKGGKFILEMIMD